MKYSFWLFLVMVSLAVSAVALDSSHYRINNGAYEQIAENESVKNNFTSSANTEPSIVIEFFTSFQKEICADYGCAGRDIPWVRVINKDSEKKIIMIRGDQYTLGSNSSVSVPLDWKLAD